MNEGRFFDNPDFVEYVRLLHKLHAAIRDGTDESEKGERIREQMDDPGSRLSQDEIASAQEISALLDSMTDPH
jgi:hypothetical protein